MRGESVGTGAEGLRTRFFSMPPAVAEYCHAFMVCGTDVDDIANERGSQSCV